jgi:hypothetical protein
MTIYNLKKGMWLFKFFEPVRTFKHHRSRHFEPLSLKGNLINERRREMSLGNFLLSMGLQCFWSEPFACNSALSAGELGLDLSRAELEGCLEFIPIKMPQNQEEIRLL